MIDNDFMGMRVYIYIYIYIDNVCMYGLSVGIKSLTHIVTWTDKTIIQLMFFLRRIIYYPTNIMCLTIVLHYLIAFSNQTVTTH